MPLYVQNGKLVQKAGALGTSAGCCCEDKKCCCYTEGNEFLLLVSSSPCPAGTTSTISYKPNLQTFCTGLSILIEWDVLSITVDPQNLEAYASRDAGVGVLGLVLTVQNVSSFEYFQRQLALSQACGRCVAICDIAIQQYSTDRFPPVNDISWFTLVYREGCDGDPHLTLYKQVGNAIGPPSVTVTLAP